MTDDEVTCQQLVELVTEFLEGTLEPRTLGQIEEHLVMCNWCVAYIDQMQATIGALASLGEQHFPDAPDSVLAALREKGTSGA